MVFTSAPFWLFFAAVCALALVVGPARRWVVLLAASAVFHVAVASWESLAALVLVTVVTYACGLGLDPSRAEPARGRAFSLGVALVAGTLLALKYGAQIAALGGIAWPRRAGGAPEALAFVGVSYYSLQALSYLFDLRLGVAEVERHLGRLGLHLAFFPKLVQGPIERQDGLLAQLRTPGPIGAADVVAGAELLVWGLFQKVVVADRLAPLVESVYRDLPHQAGLPVLLATYLFAAQIYFDFAGYTDVARGMARLLGLRLTPNFASPYGATSVAEFWRRWHMSFSSWLLDYVFKPLQLGLRGFRTWGTPVALVATFLVSGLWHGAAWTFVAWGLVHGLYLGLEALSRLRRRGKAPARPVWSGLRTLATFHLVCLAWIPFRAPSLTAALAGARNLLVALPETLVRVATGRDHEVLLFLGRGRDEALSAFALLLVGAVLRPVLRRAGVAGSPSGAGPDSPAGPWRSPWLRTVLHALLVYFLVFLGSAAQGFMYAQY